MRYVKSKKNWFGRIYSKALLSILISLLIAACGNKGPLYLEVDRQEVQALDLQEEAASDQLLQLMPEVDSEQTEVVGDSKIDRKKQ